MSNWRDEEAEDGRAARQARWRNRPGSGEPAAPVVEEPSDVDPNRAAAQAKWRAAPEAAQEDEAARVARQAKWRGAGEAPTRALREPQAPPRSRAPQSRPSLGVIIWLPLAISLAAAAAGGYALYKEVRTGERVERYHAEIMAISARLGNPTPASDDPTTSAGKIAPR